MASPEPPGPDVKTLADPEPAPSEDADRGESEDDGFLFDFERLSFGLREAVATVVVVGLLLALV